MVDLRIFANLIQTLNNEAWVRIQKHVGSRGAAPVGGVGSEAAHKKKYGRMDKMFFNIFGGTEPQVGQGRYLFLYNFQTINKKYKKFEEASSYLLINFTGCIFKCSLMYILMILGKFHQL